MHFMRFSQSNQIFVIGVFKPFKTLVNQDLKQLDLNLDMQRQLGMVWHPARIQSKAAEELINMMQLG